jgi:uncharacterized protein (DUF736 family)
MSQVSAGTMKAVQSEKGRIFKGNVLLGERLNGELQLRDHPRARLSDEAPDYEAFYRRDGSDGPLRSVGAAWLKNGVQGDFLSLTMDDPDWPNALNLTAFPPDKNNAAAEWRIVWQRPRQNVKPQPMKEAA